MCIGKRVKPNGTILVNRREYAWSFWIVQCAILHVEPVCFTWHKLSRRLSSFFLFYFPVPTDLKLLNGFGKFNSFFLCNAHTCNLIGLHMNTFSLSGLKKSQTWYREPLCWYRRLLGNNLFNSVTSMWLNLWLRCMFSSLLPWYFYTCPNVKKYITF